MTPTERRDASVELSQRSDREFDQGGDTMIAAELLWGAVAQTLLAIAEIKEWPCQGHRGYIQVATRLAEQQPHIPWNSNIAAADQPHGHFYNRNLSLGELDSKRSAAQRVLNLAAALLPIQ